jgi:hypothetical protein
MRWYGHGPYSESEEASHLSENISLAKLPNKAFDDAVYTRIVLLLRMGAKGTYALYKAVAATIRKDPKRPFLQDKKVQKLLLGNPWVQKFRMRHGIGKRVGDKKKQGKVPGAAQIEANQKGYQELIVSNKIVPELRFTGDETSVKICAVGSKTDAIIGSKQVFIAVNPDEKVPTLLIPTSLWRLNFGG